jgi:hypothetical protein
MTRTYWPQMIGFASAAGVLAWLSVDQGLALAIVTLAFLAGMAFAESIRGIK